MEYRRELIKNMRRSPLEVDAVVTPRVTITLDQTTRTPVRSGDMTLAFEKTMGHRSLWPVPHLYPNSGKIHSVTTWQSSVGKSLEPYLRGDDSLSI